MTKRNWKPLGFVGPNYFLWRHKTKRRTFTTGFSEEDGPVSDEKFTVARGQSLAEAAVKARNAWSNANLVISPGRRTFDIDCTTFNTAKVRAVLKKNRITIPLFPVKRPKAK